MQYSTLQIGRLQNKLVIEEKLPLAYAAILSENALFRFDERLQEAVMAWVEGTLDASFAIDDLSLADLQKELNVSLFQAICAMDIFLKNPRFLTKAAWYERRFVTHYEK